MKTLLWSLIDLELIYWLYLSNSTMFDWLVDESALITSDASRAVTDNWKNNSIMN